MISVCCSILIKERVYTTYKTEHELYCAAQENIIARSLSYSQGLLQKLALMLTQIFGFLKQDKYCQT